MKTLLLAATAASACALGDTAFAAGPAAVHVDHAAARVMVIPENRTDYQVTIQPGRAGLKPMTQRYDGGVLVVDGGYGAPMGFHFGWDDLNCRGSNTHRRVSVPGRGEVDVQDLPLVTIRAPLDAHIGASGAVFGEISATRSLEFGNAGCGDWRIADVRGPLRLSMSGSGDATVAASAGAHVRIAGSADVRMGPVGGELDAQISGSGDIRAAAVHGPVASQISGSGDVVIDHGDAPRVAVSVAGSGDFTFHGVAAAADIRVAGSGDVVIDRVTGPVSRRVAGSGDISIGH